MSFSQGIEPSYLYTDASGTVTAIASTPTHQRAISNSGQRNSARTSNGTVTRRRNSRSLDGVLSPFGNANLALRTNSATDSAACWVSQPPAGSNVDAADALSKS